MEPTTIGQSEKYSTMCMDQAQLPELKDAKIGDKITLTLEVRVDGLSARRYDTADKNNMVHAELCILSVKKESKEGGE